MQRDTQFLKDNLVRTDEDKYELMAEHGVESNVGSLFNAKEHIIRCLLFLT